MESSPQLKYELQYKMPRGVEFVAGFQRQENTIRTAVECLDRPPAASLLNPLHQETRFFSQNGTYIVGTPVLFTSKSLKFRPHLVLCSAYPTKFHLGRIGDFAFHYHGRKLVSDSSHLLPRH